MKIKYVKFFQPVSIPIDERSTSVVTSVDNKQHDVTLKQYLIEIKHRATGTRIYSSLFNMQWMRPDEDPKAAKGSKGASAPEEEPDTVV